jgi:hypothetical protein
MVTGQGEEAHYSGATEGNRAQRRRCWEQRCLLEATVIADVARSVREPATVKMKLENGGFPEKPAESATTCHNLPQLPRLAGLDQ